MPLVSVQGNDALLDVADFDDVPWPGGGGTGARQPSQNRGATPSGGAGMGGGVGSYQQYAYHHQQRFGGNSGTSHMNPPPCFGHNGTPDYCEEGEEVSVMTLDSALVELANNYPHNQHPCSDEHSDPPNSAGSSQYSQGKGVGGGTFHPNRRGHSTSHHHFSQSELNSFHSKHNGDAAVGGGLLSDIASIASASLHTVRGVDNSQSRLSMSSGRRSDITGNASDPISAPPKNSSSRSSSAHESTKNAPNSNNGVTDAKAKEYTESLELQVARLSFELATAQSQLDVYKFRHRRVTEERDAARTKQQDIEKENETLRRKIHDMECENLRGKLNATNGNGSRRPSDTDGSHNRERRRSSSGDVTVPSGSSMLAAGKTAICFAKGDESDDEGSNTGRSSHYNDDQAGLSGSDKNSENENDMIAGERSKKFSDERPGKNKNAGNNGFTSSGDESTDFSNDSNNWPQRTRTASADRGTPVSHSNRNGYNNSNCNSAQDEQEGWGGRLVGGVLNTLRRDKEPATSGGVSYRTSRRRPQESDANVYISRSKSERGAFWTSGSQKVHTLDKLDPNENTLTKETSNPSINSNTRSGSGLGRLFGGGNNNTDFDQTMIPLNELNSSNSPSKWGQGIFGASDDDDDESDADEDGCSVYWGDKRSCGR